MDNNEIQILIIDDNPRNLQVIGNMVAKAGYNVAVATGGKEALEFLNHEAPDLILMDVMMPGMNGYEACRLIKTNSELLDVPVIFLTALNDISDKLKAFEAGGVDYISKPFIKEEVLARISVHVRLKKSLERIKVYAIRDEMTGLYNRRFAYEIIEKCIAQSRRDETSFLLCYIDVDNLKKVNDTLGHSEGDRFLLEIIRDIKKSIRESDYFFRVGGDELLLLLPRYNICQSEILIQRIRSHLRKKNFEGVEMDFSYGFVSFDPGEDYTYEDLIKEADMAMYENKKKKKAASYEKQPS